MRGQSAVEYLLLFSAVLVIFAVVTLGQMINPMQEAGRDTLYLSQARSAADAIAGAVNSVYANGQGATKSVGLSIDQSWNLQLTENKLMINLETSSGTENAKSNLRYGFNDNLQNLSTGAYTVIAEWSGDQENIVRDGYKIYIRIKPPKGI
ncbi:MAG: hypothetical protein ACE5H0_13420 [Bacteroidota bacterium]